MKKAISTILSLVMLAKPFVGTTCFADEPSDNVGAYVPNQERSEQFKFDEKIAVSHVKIAGCIAVGIVAVVAAMLAGLKIYEEKLPDPINKSYKSTIRCRNGLCYVRTF